LFYLCRYRKELESKAVFDHEQAAKQGMSYSERQKGVESAEKYKEEYEVICALCDQLAAEIASGR
jgi:hypothetical protein